MVTVQFVAAAGFALVVFVAAANVVVDLYARGVVRAAVDEAARRGAPFDATPQECTARGRDVLAELLGGRLGHGVRVDCRETATTVTARADVVLASWLPGLPDWSFTLAGTAVKEREP